MGALDAEKWLDMAQAQNSLETYYLLRNLPDVVKHFIMLIILNASFQMVYNIF